MSDKYTLNGHEAVPCEDLLEWGRWMEENHGKRHVGDTQISPEVRVSTVFLGLDHSFGGPAPLLFETMIFGGPLDQEQERYSNWEEAEAGHAEWVKKAENPTRES